MNAHGVPKHDLRTRARWAGRTRSSTMPRRSCLTVPGSSEQMLARSADTDSDMVVLDLEDSVPPSGKEPARERVIHAIRTHDWKGRLIGVRVNGWATPWTVADVLRIVDGCGERLDVLVLPKTEDAAMVQALELVLGQAEHAAGLTAGEIGLEVQIESAGGVQQLNAISVASPRLEAIALGPLDLMASLGMPTHAPVSRRRLDPIASAIVVAGRSAGVQVIDGPYVAIRDLDGLREDAEWAANLGFDGKWVLHPGQVGVVNEVFSPSAEHLAEAERRLETYEAALADGARGAVLIDGEMVDEASARNDRLVVERGRRLRYREPT